MGRRFALLIATYTYEDEGLLQLTAPGHDAEALAEVLSDPDIAGFEVTTLVNEPHHRVGAAIGEFFDARDRDDLALLYFSGHGLKDTNGHLHLATADTRLANRRFTSVPAELIDQAMTDCRSTQQVLILDCCYSGAFPSGQLAKGDTDATELVKELKGSGRTVLTASNAAQSAFEGNRLHGSVPRSVFTKHLVEGLREGSADMDGDGEITLDELYDYVYREVVAEMPQQGPKKLANIEGRTVIAQNVKWSLPDHLQHSLGSAIVEERLGGVAKLAHLYGRGNERVRACAAERLRLLTDDDSRKVSAAAAAALGQGAEALPATARESAELASLLEQATHERDSGALDQAEEHYLDALERAIRQGARRQEGWAWDGIGSCLWRAGQFETARKFFARADRRADETGDVLLKAWSLYNFGLYQRQHGETAKARDFLKRSLALAEANECHPAAGWTHHQLAELAHEERDTHQEREHYAAAARTGRLSGDLSLEGWSLIHVAQCAVDSGDLSQARRDYSRAKDIGARISHWGMVEEADAALARMADPAGS